MNTESTPNTNAEELPPWVHEEPCSGDKQIMIIGPGTLQLALDNDDVNGDEIAEALPRIVDALNFEWSGGRAAVVKHADEQLETLKAIGAQADEMHAAATNGIRDAVTARVKLEEAIEKLRRWADAIGLDTVVHRMRDLGLVK